MKLVDVVGNGQKNALGQHIFFPPVKIPPEVHIFFYNGKAAFSLNAPVHSELSPVFCCDPLQRFLSLLLHHFGDTKTLVPLLHWSLAVVAVDAFIFIRTSLTAFTFVYSHSTDIAVTVLTVPVIDRFELPSV